MKKVIVAEFIRPYLDQEKSFPDRSDIELFTASADVTWYGMKFSSVAPEAQRAIEDFIEKRARTKGPRSSRDSPFS